MKKIAIKVNTEFDRENVISWFEKHYPNCNIGRHWAISDVLIGDIWFITNVGYLFGYEESEPHNQNKIKDSSKYTILEGVPTDLSMPNTETIKTREQELKIYRVEFEGVYPVGSCLVLTAYNQKQAEEMAKKTIAHTDVFVVNELTLTEPQVIEYLSGDY